MKSVDQHRRAMDIFAYVCDMPEAERDRCLQELCRDDADVRRKVEAMLRTDGEDHRLIDAAEDGRALDKLAARFGGDTPDWERIPEKIGGYQIVDKLGQGGMGVIYKARQESPRRTVALKVLRPGLFNLEMMKRFHHEAHVLGQLQHPGIAHIHEAGLGDLPQGKLPFFVMEFIDGERLDRFAATNELDTKQRLELVARVCDAVQHAHQKGIIHRDLKPSNILVVAKDGGTTTGTTRSSTGSTTRDDGIGQPKILDFGIARVTDADLQTVTVQTEVGQLVGTLAYMSPEQVGGKSADLDTRCDVYALGVISYELLVGKRPHDLTGLSITEAARIIREEEPPSVGDVDKKLRGDVETIVSKAMDKDRERRYASAAAFATDIRRFLFYQPIEARRASTFYHLSKFARRNKGFVGGLVATFVMLLVALIGISYGLWQANMQRDKANRAKERAQAVVDFQSAMWVGIDVENMGIGLNRMLREEARAALNDAATDADAARLATFEQVLSRINVTTIANRSLDETILSRAVDTLDDEFVEQPVLQAELRSSLADIYESIGLHEKALAQARIEWKTCCETIGEEHPDTLVVRSHICKSLLDAHQYSAGEECARELLEVLKRVLGTDNVHTLATMSNLGEALVQLTRPVEAQAVLREALEGMQRKLGPRHLDTLNTLEKIGELHRQRREYDEAMAAFRTVLEGRTAQLGEDHSDTLAAMNKVAMVLYLRKDYARSEPYFRRLAETRARTYGDDHPETLSARHNLGHPLRALGRYEEAESVIMDTLDRKRRVLGPDHPMTVLTLGNAGYMMIKLQRWEEAENLMQEALTIAQRTLGPDNSKTLVALSDLASVYAGAGRYEPAERYAREALEGGRRVLGDADRLTIMQMGHLGKILMADGRLGEAEVILQEALAECREHHTDSVVFTGILGQLSTTLIALDRGAEAEPLCRELLAWSEKRVLLRVQGQAHLWLGRALLEQDKLDEAESSLSKSIDLMAPELTHENWAVCFANCLKNAVAVRQGRSESASAAVDAFHRLLRAKENLNFEVRKLFIAEAREALRDAGINPED